MFSIDNSMFLCFFYEITCYFICKVESVTDNFDGEFKFSQKKFVILDMIANL